MKEKIKKVLGEEREDSICCLLSAEGQRFVLYCAQNTMLIAPDGDWKKKSEATAFNFKHPYGGPWQLIYTGGTFRQKPLPGTKGDERTDPKFDYVSWDGQFWQAELKHEGQREGGRPYFRHVSKDLTRPKLKVPDSAVCDHYPG